MPGSSTTPGRSDLAMVRPKRVAFRARNSVGTRGLAFAAQWLAYALPYRRFADVLADGVTVGAPPDQFNQRGQNWHQPPWRPDARTLSRAGRELVLDPTKPHRATSTIQLTKSFYSVHSAV